jgi:hypothetical protein
VIRGAAGEIEGARHDSTVVSRPSRADRARRRAGQLHPEGGQTLRGEPVGSDQADAPGAPDREHRTGQDRRLPSPAPLLEEHADELQAIVAGKAGITLREIKAELATRGIEVKALSTVADMLHRLGLSRKKRR